MGALGNLNQQDLQVLLSKNAPVSEPLGTESLFIAGDPFSPPEGASGAFVCTTDSAMGVRGWFGVRIVTPSNPIYLQGDFSQLSGVTLNVVTSGGEMFISYY